MAQNDLLKRYLDAGAQFTQMTRSRAEAIVKELVKAGELQREQAQERVEEIVDRSRKNTEQLVDQIRNEIADQLGSLGLATKDDLARLEAKLGGGAARPATSAPAAAAAAAPSGAKKAPAAPAAAKKAPAKKAAKKA